MIVYLENVSNVNKYMDAEIVIKMDALHVTIKILH